MRKQSDWVLQAILSKSPEDKRKELKSYLPEADRLRIEDMPSFTANVAEVEGSLMDRIHWSWFLSPLKPYSLDEQTLFLRAAPLAARHPLSRELGLPPLPNEELAEMLKAFLNQTLLESVTGSPLALLPIGFLPPSPLAFLLRLTKHELIHLIDSLALYDLAEELRQIVETKILKKIYSFLSEKEKKFLRQMVHTKQSYPTARLKLDGWDGSEEALRNLLHKRGIARLGVALSQENRDFCWYICHLLDIGRGVALAKSCAAETAHEISDSIVRQIEDVFQRREGLA